ncbi:PDZ and LIM domain protein 3-like [Watersipora subatra]|uniref:PDZ and LIM domain protein 3-like n=1 Tax=Watersipora subatra TaxID=2589382 RepID=UPI00355B685C
MAAAQQIQTITVSLRRHQNSTQWGFKMQGGRDQGLPLFIQKVHPKSPAAKRGLRPGDMVLAICRTPAANLSHDQAKMEILRAGNDLDFTVQRGAIDINHPAFGITAPAPEQRSEVEENSQYSQPGHHPFRQVYSRTYAILENQLEESERGGEQPAAITDVNYEDRPDYIRTEDHTIQKAYGQR